jgi:O-antigen/teichoic acid export membrane protein
MSKIRRNLLSMLLSQCATFMLTLITVSILPKRLGADTYGALAFAGAYIGYFALAANLGSNPFLVKTLARDPSQLGRYVSNAVIMKVLLGSVLAVAAVAGAHILNFPPQTTRIIEVSGFGIVLAAVSDVLAAALQATERMGKLALWFTVQQYVTGAIAIALLVNGKGPVVYCLVIACGPVIPIVAYGYQLWPDIFARPRPSDANPVPRGLGHELWPEIFPDSPSAPARRAPLRPDLRLWKGIALGGLPFVSWSFILLIYGSIDILMLEHMTGSKTVAWYSLAYTWVGIPVFFPAVLVTVIFPSLSNKALGSSAEFSRVVNNALRLVIFAGTPMAIGIALTAGNIVGLLHYPAGFGETVILIRILAFHIPIVAMDMILATALAAKDRQAAWLVVGCIACIFNPLVNLIAIPFTAHHFGNGAIGAAVVTVATEIVMMVGAIYLRPEHILDRRTVTFGLRCVAASAAMIPTVLLVNNAPLAVKVIVGIMTFAIASVVLRLVSIRAARDAVPRFLRSFRERGQLTPVPTGVE